MGTQKRWKTTAGSVILALVSLVLTLLAAEGAPKPGGTFTLAIKGDVSTLDPGRQGRDVQRHITAATSQGLVQASGLNWRTLPNLAESWEVLNPTAWKFNLRKDVRFHNGQPLTSADVKFSFDRVMGTINPKFPGAGRGIYKRLIDRIEITDDHSVVIHTRNPEAALLNYVLSGAIYILPKVHIEKVGDRDFAKHPIGSGPFKFKERRIAEYISIEANEDYWNLDPIPGTFGPAKIKEAVFRIIPQLQTSVAALKAKELDGIIDIDNDTAKDLERMPGITVFYTAQNTPWFIMMNWRYPKDKKTGTPNPFHDVRVRKALNYALDIDALINNYLTGREYRTTLVGKGIIGYNPDVPFYTYDPERAKRLLAEAGYAKGFKTTIHVQADHPPYVDAMVQYWREVGIQVDFKISTTPVLLRSIMRKKMKGLTVWPGRRPTGFYRLYVQHGAPLSLNARDDRVDELIIKQAREFDEAKRAELIHKITRILWEDSWFIPLWERVSMKALRSSRWDYEQMPAVSRSFDLTKLKEKE